jgi:hypothetical protein
LLRTPAIFSVQSVLILWGDVRTNTRPIDVVVDVGVQRLMSAWPETEAWSSPANA